MHPLKAYRRKNKFTLREAGDKLKCSKSYISMIEREQREVSAETAYQWEQITDGELRADKFNKLIRDIRKGKCCQNRAL